MALRMLGKDPNSPNGNSPTVYVDEETDRYLVQGFKVLDEERLAQMDIPDHETVVEIPRYMVGYFLPSDRNPTTAVPDPEEKKGAGPNV
ncbi:hypothetical protein [Streptomyces malaysiensis]|uniref:Uncharacterized protein n=1 Tax=Streptomyces malaysiensis TaxID=92644 RepID=A0A7X6B0Y9_STRMQ|nr:hypothetical protein [Streptomyces malaysiensis]NIY69623.1 hypothetical protein [Streptomyces malaysiensis]